MNCKFCKNEKLLLTGSSKDYNYSRCTNCNSTYRENVINSELELIERKYSDKYLLEKALEYAQISKNDLIGMIEEGDE